LGPYRSDLISLDYATLLLVRRPEQLSSESLIIALYPFVNQPTARKLSAMPSSRFFWPLFVAAGSHAYLKGFNLGATLLSGVCKTQADWNKEFKTLASLPGRFTAARLYASSDCNTLASAVPAAIATETTLLAGVWTEGEAHYQAEKAALLGTIQQYGYDWLIGVSVGSEDLYRGDTTAETLAGQINDIRGALWSFGAGAVLVGHVDTWTTWASKISEHLLPLSKVFKKLEDCLCSIRSKCMTLCSLR